MDNIIELLHKTHVKNEHMKDECATFRASKKDAIKAAKELFYPQCVLMELNDVTYEDGGIAKLNRIMRDARVRYL